MARKALVVKCKKQRKFKVQEYNRCQTCGRPRSIYRKFMLCRICFRENAHKGVIPGITKSSW